MTRESPYVLVTLLGGPLDGLRRHAIRGSDRAWFMEPRSERRHEYAADPDNPLVWRYVEPGQEP